MSTEQAMRAEIERAGLKVLSIGPLFGAGLDAIVENERGQFMWSVYRRELLDRAPPPRPAIVPLGQKSLF